MLVGKVFFFLFHYRLNHAQPFGTVIIYECDFGPGEKKIRKWRAQKDTKIITITIVKYDNALVVIETDASPFPRSEENRIKIAEAFGDSRGTRRGARTRARHNNKT